MMALFATLLACSAILAPVTVARSIADEFNAASFPVWPDAYTVLKRIPASTSAVLLSTTVKFRFIVPYIEKYQQGPLRCSPPFHVKPRNLMYDMQFWRHTSAGLQRVERDNSEIWIEHGGQDMRWYVTPANHSADGCVCESMSDAGGPTLSKLPLQTPASYPDTSSDASEAESAGSGSEDASNSDVEGDAWDTVDDFRKAVFEELLSPALPPMSAPKWKFENTTTTTLSVGSSHQVNVWLHHAVHNEGYGEVAVDWRMYVTPDGIPVKLDMWGPNWFTGALLLLAGGHWDHYIAEFYEYAASPQLNAQLFSVPPVCQSCVPTPPDQPAFQGGHHLSHRMHQATSGMLPRKVDGDPAYDAHCNAYGRAHAHRAEYERRRSHFADNSDYITLHNLAKEATFTLGMNHFGDWSDEEYAAMKQVSKRKQDVTDNYTIKPEQHKVTVPLHMLPETVDWRGSGADSEVKDQAMCGSCWAFAAVAPMEAAYYREFKMLSEQFLMDCSWPEGNTACNGGYQDKAFSFAVASGGIPTNDDYPYKGVNMPCQPDTQRAASIKGYVNVRAYQPQELKEAILTKGPMTVSLDADAKSFRFYKSGIYYNVNCKTNPATALDHAVIVSGYGRDPKTGQKYWVLKNLWSTWWGEGGYIRIDMEKNDCGVSALPEYVLLDEEETDSFRNAAQEDEV